MVLSRYFLVKARGLIGGINIENDKCPEPLDYGLRRYQVVYQYILLKTVGVCQNHWLSLIDTNGLL